MSHFKPIKTSKHRNEPRWFRGDAEFYAARKHFHAGRASTLKKVAKRLRLGEGGGK